MMRARIVAALLMVYSTASATITPSATSDRNSGTAPLVVFFDATGTTHSDGTVLPFHDLLYTWNFADTTSGSWSISGTSKNTAYGPLAGHVFEPASYTENCGAGANTCKTYSVTLTVRDTAGVVSATPITISVRDPNSTFASTTVCVSRTGDTTGCPGGSTLDTSDTGNFETIMSTQITAGKRRILFHSGQSWAASAEYEVLAAGPGMIGTFDAEGVCSANNPCSSKATVNTTSTGTGAVVHFNDDDWRVTDMAFNGPGGSSSTRGVFFEHTKSGDGVTYNLNNIALRMDMTNMQVGYDTGGIGPSTVIGDLVSVVDSTDFNSTDGPGSTGGNCIFFDSARMLILGNNLDRNQVNEHVIRSGHTEKAVISNNRFASPGANKHNVKIHSAGTTAGLMSESIILSDNLLEGGTNDTQIAIGPQAPGNSEQVQNVLVERNFIKLATGIGGTQGIAIWARLVTARDNLFDFSLSGVGMSGISISQRGGAPPLVELNRAYNNSAYSGATTKPSSLVQIASSASTTLAYNNLLYITSTTNTHTVVSDAGISSSLATNTDQTGSANPFIGPMSAAAGFRLTPGNALLNSGTSVPNVRFADYAGALVPQGSGPPQGAFESPLPGNISGAILRGASVQ